SSYSFAAPLLESGGVVVALTRQCLCPALKYSDDGCAINIASIKRRMCHAPILLDCDLYRPAWANSHGPFTNTLKSGSRPRNRHVESGARRYPQVLLRPAVSWNRSRRTDE